MPKGNLGQKTDNLMEKNSPREAKDDIEVGNLTRN